MSVAFNILASDGWIEVANSSDLSFFLENQSLDSVLVSFSGFAPAADDPGHILTAGEGIPRVADGNVYVRSMASNITRKLRVVISK